MIHVPQRRSWGFWLLAGLSMLTVSGCSPKADSRTEGRVVLEYWEKWTDFEREAMARVVENFNRSQDRIFVRLLSVSRVDQKMMLATAGGVPPDIAGLWDINLPSFAENNALMPLDRLAREAGLRPEDYNPVFWRLCQSRGQTNVPRSWPEPRSPSPHDGRARGLQ